MENVVVVTVVVLAMVYLFRGFFRASRKDAPTCGCGCSGCRPETSCPPEGTGPDKAQPRGPHAA